MRSFKTISQNLQESVNELVRNELDVIDQYKYKHKIANYRNLVI